MLKVDHLYAKPSFIKGMGRILDVGSTRNIYNTSKTEEEADCRALETDWYLVGMDIREAMKIYDRERKQCSIR